MAKTNAPDSVVQLSLPLAAKSDQPRSGKESASGSAKGRQDRGGLCNTKVVGLSEKRAEKRSKDQNRLYRSILGRIKHLQD